MIVAIWAGASRFLTQDYLTNNAMTSQRRPFWERGQCGKYSGLGMYILILLQDASAAGPIGYAQELDGYRP